VTATAAVVLAAGQGTRMRSRLPKVLHPVAGRPMLDHVLAALAAAGIEQQVVVTGHGADEVEAHLADRALSVRQEPQRGTADAVRAGLARISAEVGQVVVAMGDAPLVPAELFTALRRAQAEGGACIALLSARVADPAGYGRLVRAADGSIRAIVEESDADAATLDLSIFTANRATTTSGGSFWAACWPSPRASPTPRRAISLLTASRTRHELQKKSFGPKSARRPSAGGPRSRRASSPRSGR